MGLRPIGSEKLKGQDKINRIMELATYGESKKNTDNHISTKSFIKEARDGSFYAIVNEKDGYYLKTGINENALDYINGIRNKKKNRFKSYSAALKKLNLALKPINERYAGGEGDPLYEQSSGENKFVLKTPEVEIEDEEMVTDDDMGDEEDFEMEDELVGDDEMGDDELALDDEMALDTEEEMEGAMKSIQKLTGKLGQKLRANEEEIESEDIKYVINSVLSAVDLDKLDDEDKEDIVDRFDEDESEYGDEEIASDDLEMGDEELDIEDIEDEGEGTEFDMEAMVPESTKKRKNIISEQGAALAKFLKGKINTLIKKGEKDPFSLTASEISLLTALLVAIPAGPIFVAVKAILKAAKGKAAATAAKKLVSKSTKKSVAEGVATKSLKNRIANLLESYYEEEDPKNYIKDKVEKNKTLKFIEENSNSIEQELATKRYIKENKYSKLKGLTNSGLLVIESDDEKISINKAGRIV